MSDVINRLAAIFAESSIDRLFALAASLFGAVFVLMGVVYGFRAVWQSAMVPEEMVLAGAICLGAAAMVFGDILWSRGWRVPAAGLAGSGLGTLYLSLYAAYEWYELIGRVPTFALLLLVTGVGAVFAVRRESQLMASLGFLCGMATPLLLSNGTGDIAMYFLYLGLLDCAAIYAAVKRRWVILAWLSVITTFGVRIAWALFETGQHPAGVASISAALLGALFAAGALTPGLSKRIAVPFVSAALLALLALVPSVGMGTPEVATAISLAAIVGLMSLIRTVGARRDWAGLGIVGTALGCAALCAMGIQWALSGGVAWTSLVALAVVPIAALWTVDALLGTSPNFERRIERALVVGVSGAVAVLVAVITNELEFLPVIGVAIAANSWLVGLDLVQSEMRTELSMSDEGNLFPPLGLIVATGCLTVSNSPAVATVCVGAVLYVSALCAPFFVVSERMRSARFAPALFAPILVIPLYMGWQEWVGTGLNGILGLLMGAAAVGGVAIAGSDVMKLDDKDRKLAHSVYLIVALFFASMAVPMQLEREWLTVGWALEGAALAWATRSVRQPVIAVASLVLLATVTVRLVLNPAVMTYHLVAHPTVWNWILYGYGLPALALFGASRTIRIPDWIGDGAVLRRVLELSGIAVLFAMLNLQISHAFAQGGELTLYDVAIRAQLARTLGWAVFALGLLGFGMGDRRNLRWMGVALFAIVVGKIGLFDLWVLHGFGRVLLLLGVGPLFFTAAGILQRRESPTDVIEELA